MSLTTCKECKEKISNKAEMCPHCGAKIPHTSLLAWIAMIMGAFFCFIIICASINVTKPNATIVQKPQSALQEEQIPTPPTAEQLKEQKIKASFSRWDGSHIGLEKYIKAHLNNPDSYKHGETRYLQKENKLFIMTTFYASNVFGGIIKQVVVAEVDLDGNVLKAEWVTPPAH